MVRLIEIKNIDSLLNQIKSDIERLASIEINDSDKTKELKKRLAELKTARNVLASLNQDTSIIDSQIAELEKQLKKSYIKLSEKEKLLLKLLEHYNIKINRKKSGGKSVKKVIYVTEDKIIEFDSYGELQRQLNIEGKDSNPKRNVEKWIKNKKPKCVIIADNELVYAHPDIPTELYQKYIQ